MPELMEFDPAERVAAGALGRPGQRTFLIQAERGGAMLSVLVEKQQVDALARQVLAFLTQLDARFPPEPGTEVPAGEAVLHEPAEPLFRARAIRLGFDIGRGLVVLELHEFDTDDDADEAEDDDEDVEAGDEDEPEGRVARIFATRGQVRAMAEQGAAAVSAGRPVCELCRLPMGEERLGCPQTNWQGCPGMN
jgi:uncharacterized repeat protein (TIGR03847 family)